MDVLSTHIGIIESLQERAGEKGNYMTGWIKSASGERVFFHQNGLKEKFEILNIANGKLILFELNRSGERKNRLDARNATVNCDSFLVDNFESYSEEFKRFVITNAGEPLSKKIYELLVAKEGESKTTNIENKLIRDRLSELFESRKIKSEKKINESVYEDLANKSFLATIFSKNSLEYNNALFHTLISGIKSIEDDDTFNQIKFLLDFNKTTNEIDGFEYNIYRKCSNRYKLQLWLDSSIDFCQIDVIEQELDKSSYELRERIIKRCGQLGQQLSSPESNWKMNDGEKVHFQDIRQKIITELTTARSKIQIAVAWFTNDQLFNMLCTKLKEDVDIELIILNDYINNWEFGLPFQKFIDLGGKLYLSNYPNMMHHKFCLIDGSTVLNGSYNWTYYAELLNDENLMIFHNRVQLYSEFEHEFEEIKLKIGSNTDRYDAIDESQIEKFERKGFRELISKDLGLRAESIYETNPIDASRLFEKATTLDENNISAMKRHLEIAPEVELQKRSLHVQKIAEEQRSENTDKTKSATSEHPVIDNPISNANILNESHVPSDENNQPIIPESDKSNLLYDASIQSALSVRFSSKNQQSSQLPSLRPLRSIAPLKLAVPFRATNRQITNNTSPILENFSVTNPLSSSKQFGNLKIVVALDISGSMANNYNAGLMQKVVEKLLAIAIGLTSQTSLDVWIFNTKAHCIKPFPRTDFSSYVKREILDNYKIEGGTQAIVALKEIFNSTSANSSDQSVFTIVITDGEDNKADLISEFLQKASSMPFFWQFVGIGSKFEILKSFYHISDRLVNNYGFFSLNDLATASDDELYRRLLSDFPSWFSDAKAAKIID